MEDKNHEFWNSQPMQRESSQAEVITEEGPIDSNTDVSRIRPDPYPMYSAYEWSNFEWQRDGKELVEFLKNHYASDKETGLGIYYPPELLSVILTSEWVVTEWLICVRVSSNKKLGAFIAGFPITLRVDERVTKAVEVNFFCIHSKIRGKGLAPLMIKELTRRVNLKGVFQAFYSAGNNLPGKLMESRFVHRHIDTKVLVSAGFTSIRNTTMAKMITEYKLADSTKSKDFINLKDLRSLSQGKEFEEEVLRSCFLLAQKFYRKFRVALAFEDSYEKEFTNTLKNASTCCLSIDWSQRPLRVKAFASWGALEISNGALKTPIKSGCLHHYSYQIQEPGSQEDSDMFLVNFMNDCLIEAKKEGYHLFTCMLNYMDNHRFANQLKFRLGTGLLNYYIYNWNTVPSMDPSNPSIAVPLF